MKTYHTDKTGVPRWRTALLLFIFLLLAASLAIGKSSFLDTVKDTNEPFDAHSVPQVMPVDKKSVLVNEPYQGGAFRVLTRKQEIERYKCSSCHTDKPVLARQGLELSHGDITLNHGEGARALICIDCHHPQERDFLEDKKGRKIDFDHSYQLCGQCHFRQKRDWLGGAHGKRVSNWAGERVVYNCATCHNPHAPRFEKRFPATYSAPLN